MSSNVRQTAAVCGAGWMAAGDVSQLWYETVVSQLCGYLQAVISRSCDSSTG